GRVHLRAALVALEVDVRLGGRGCRDVEGDGVAVVRQVVPILVVDHCEGEAAAAAAPPGWLATAAGSGGERSGDEDEDQDQGANLRCMGDAACHRFDFPSVGGGESKLRPSGA